MTESHRGAARNARGPLTFTVRVHNYISENPGVTRDQVVDVALQRGWVDRGYAHRLYANQINGGRRKRAADVGQAGGAQAVHEETPASIAATKSDQAVRFAVRKVIASMRAKGAVVADESGGLRVVRDLRSGKRGPTRQQILTTPEGNRQIVAEIELLRVLRPVLERLVDPNFYISVGTRKKLKAWAEATLKHAPPGSGGAP